MMSTALRHFLDISELPPKELRNHALGQRRHEGEAEGAEKGTKPLEGKTLAMIFDRPRPAPGCRSTSACASSAASPSC